MSKIARHGFLSNFTCRLPRCHVDTGRAPLSCSFSQRELPHSLPAFSVIIFTSKFSYIWWSWREKKSRATFPSLERCHNVLLHYYTILYHKLLYLTCPPFFSSSSSSCLSSWESLESTASSQGWVPYTCSRQGWVQSGVSTVRGEYLIHVAVRGEYLIHVAARGEYLIYCM